MVRKRGVGPVEKSMWPTCYVSDSREESSEIGKFLIMKWVSGLGLKLRVSFLFNDWAGEGPYSGSFPGSSKSWPTKYLLSRIVTSGWGISSHGGSQSGGLCQRGDF
eukprot:TRINITY_DN20244_c0_g1_i1.p1 TRINITY_DN20244_c0_g1~~TRINITY_DN20244_c0_g1_i1.p1  ORF type:complete len:106 (+),score=17.95 TRINITY_DN20244_c0_g1_i1:1035-1352(+)